ncbi:Hypothetical protein PHPALM_6571 [Phytophthora palmivora]|uniref:RING-type domain-containing protein n=1 Tax=Phytophthora palmivora TaxID=4796 RepID=A0A2P4YEH6_9STRA|nr:Hypothetical protein PHPALM_6571 [Phytophthora palmivora]
MASSTQRVVLLSTSLDDIAPTITSIQDFPTLCQICMDAPASIFQLCGVDCLVEVCSECLLRHITASIYSFYPGVLPKVRCPVCLNLLNKTQWEHFILPPVEPEQEQDQTPQNDNSHVLQKYVTLCRQSCGFQSPCCHIADYTMLPDRNDGNEDEIEDEDDDTQLKLTLEQVEALTELQLRGAEFCYHRQGTAEFYDFLKETFHENLEKVLWRVLPKIVDEERRASLLLWHLNKEPNTATRCCGMEICFKCKAVNHHDGNCRDFIEDADVVECRGCGVTVVMVDGCDSLYCLCGHAFSWSEEVARQNAQRKLLAPADNTEYDLWTTWHYRMNESLQKVSNLSATQREMRLTRLVRDHRPLLRQVLLRQVYRRRMIKKNPESIEDAMIKLKFIAESPESPQLSRSLSHWGRDRRHRWRRYWTRWRLWLLLHSKLIVVIISTLLFLKLWHSFLLYRRFLAWTVAPVPAHEVPTFISSLWRETQRFNRATPRGIVLPLFDDIALLGFSLLLELRRLQVTEPVEVPHCGDLSLKLQTTMHELDQSIRFYDVCELAAAATMDGQEERHLFCVDVDHCHYKFRSFDIKVLAVLYSKFQEVMLLDADTMFFQSPESLWETDKYKETGTLFFHDRISYELSYLAKRRPLEDVNVGAVHRFLAGFDVTPYGRLGVVESRESRPQTSRQLLGLDFGFQPSAFLLNSHVWRLRSGHQMDSSLVLWNKARQPRATTILASFVSLNGLPTAPSYGDKELYWLACELAETEYAFSDFAVGTVGSDLLTAGRHNDGVLCGDALQHYPVQMNPSKGPGADVEPLYMNSDNIVEWGREARRLYRTAARPAELYPGSFTERKLLQTCPFDVTTMELAPLERMLLTQRQHLYDEVAGRIDEQGTWWHS